MAVRVGNINIANDAPLTLIAGPCVIESQAHCLKMATELKKLTDEVGLSLIFKSSFDKANRTSVKSFRGVGMTDGLDILAHIKQQTSLPITTDVHHPEQCQAVAEVADILQIPAFLCRQTDLLQAAAATGRVVNLKKGQFMAPWDTLKAVEKINTKNIILTERGSSFGYNRLVSDLTAIEVMSQGGVPVVFDATHSAQQPAAQGSKSGGNRIHSALLARAAVAVGVAGLFVEVHDDPDNAPCDGNTMLSLASLKPLLQYLKLIDNQTKQFLHQNRKKVK